MSVVKISTTGTLSPVPINDLGAASFTHPIVDYVIWDSATNAPFTLEEVRDSIDLQAASDLGYIVIVDEDDNLVTNISSLLSADKHYTHTQGTPVAIWNITHNLEKRPSVDIVDSGGTSVEGDIQYLTSNTLKISFGVPFGGKAYMN